MPSAIAHGSMEDRLRKAIDHLVEGVQVIGHDWTYLYLNETAARHGQRRVSELIGRTMIASYPGIEATEVFRRIRVVLNGGRPDTMLNEFVFASGERRWFELRIDPVPDGVCVISLDVTDRLQAEREVRDQEERMRFALQAAGMGVWQLTLATGDLEWSETIAALVGVAHGSGPRTLTQFLEWIDPRDREEVLRAVKRVVSGTTEEFQVDFRIQRADGSLRWMEGHGRVIRDVDGAPHRIIGVGIDATGRRETELQLQQSQKMEAFGRLAGGIAHDFNNQLTAVLGFCDLARAAVDPDTSIGKDLQQVHDAARRAMALTSQLLAFSRRQVLAIQPVDLNALVGRISEMLSRLIGIDVRIELDLDVQASAIRGDAGQLENAVTNLAINARDAMPSGGILTMRTRSVEIPEAAPRAGLTPGRYVALSVADTGHGMDAATRARIFEPFFTTKAAGKGTGLGLSTVYGVVKQMGGSIEVDSDLGRGTIFHLYFPATA